MCGRDVPRMCYFSYRLIIRLYHTLFGRYGLPTCDNRVVLRVIDLNFFDLPINHTSQIDTVGTPNGCTIYFTNVTMNNSNECLNYICNVVFLLLGIFHLPHFTRTHSVLLRSIPLTTNHKNDLADKNERLSVEKLK